MKRTVYLLIAALSVSLLLGGCGQNSDPLAIREFIIGDRFGRPHGAGSDAGTSGSDYREWVKQPFLRL